MNERRVARRYDVAVPVHVAESGLPDMDKPRGLTRDISTSGLYFTMAQPPEPGSRVELMLTLPGFLTGGSDLLIEVVGRVVRVDTREALAGGSGAASIGVAAHIEKYDIISTRPAVPGTAVAV